MKMKNLMAVSAAMACLVVGQVQVTAMTINPGSANGTSIWTGNNPNVDPNGLFTGGVALYGALAGVEGYSEYGQTEHIAYYETEFASLTDATIRPQQAVPNPVAVGPITGYNGLFLFVKDHASTPAWYIFDITGWNGVEDINMQGFWSDQSQATAQSATAGISGVWIFGARDVQVPDGGLTVALLGMGLTGLGMARRFIKR